MTASNDDALVRAQARVGSVLDEKWRLEALIGLGGMAAVYAGRHRNGARGAVKLLHPELGRVSEVRERFLREGYAANKVEHPGAVKVLDDDIVRSGPDQGAAYLIMELLEGESIEERIHLRGLPFPIDEVLAIADDVLDVLAAAHDKGVIHRDLKPENLFLHVGDTPGPFGWHRVKVVDFGLARIAHGEGVTRAGMAIGTPSYMAPEQAEGRSDHIDGRSDLFGVGAIMFRLIAGRRVHEANNVIELVTKMARLPAPKLRSVRADAPEAVAAIVDRALQFERDARYDNAAAMREDVRAAREGRPLPSLANDGALFGTEPTIAANLEIRASSHRSDPPSATPRTVPAKDVRPKSGSHKGVVVSLVWVIGVLIAAVAVIGVRRRSQVTIDLASSASSRAEVPAPSAASDTASPSPLASSPPASDEPDAAAPDAPGPEVGAPAAAKTTAKPSVAAPKPKTKKPIPKKKK